MRGQHAAFIMHQGGCGLAPRDPFPIAMTRAAKQAERSLGREALVGIRQRV